MRYRGWAGALAAGCLCLAPAGCQESPEDGAAGSFHPHIPQVLSVATDELPSPGMFEGTAARPTDVDPRLVVDRSLADAVVHAAAAGRASLVLVVENLSVGTPAFGSWPEAVARRMADRRRSWPRSWRCDWVGLTSRRRNPVLPRVRGRCGSCRSDPGNRSRRSAPRPPTRRCWSSLSPRSPIEFPAALPEADQIADTFG